MTSFAYGIYAVLTDTIKLQQASSVDSKLAALGAGNPNHELTIFNSIELNFGFFLFWSLFS